ncbi:MAG TPA: EAL domain-containing protein [Thiobacillaceae bacterium]|nr:EAL domain-containing protein [Thiobacillaceae bacterium]
MVKRLISIRLKVLFFAALSLLLATAAFTWLAIDQHRTGQASNMAIQHERALALTRQLLDQQHARLQSLASLVAEIPGVRSALANSDPAALRLAFSPFWSELNLTHGMEHVAFVSAGGQPLGDWGFGAPDATLGRLASEVARRESPMNWLHCQSTCFLSTVIPLVRQGRFVGVVLVAAGLQDAVMQFRGLSNMELAVLDAGQQVAARNTGDRPGRLISVSGGNEYAGLMHSLLENPPSQLPNIYYRDGHAYSLFLFPAPVSSATGIQFLAINDVTLEHRQLLENVRSSLLVGLAVLALSAILLFLMLRPSMQRLRLAMEALPMLGRSQFAEARAAFDEVGPRHIRDEVDDLARLTHELADTLELLQQDNERHAEQLMAQARQLAHERDFAAGLLDTAPVMILTYSEDGRIRLANANAVKVSGYGLGDLLGKSFHERFLLPNQRKKHAELITHLQSGQIIHNEGTCPRPDSQERDVVWFHSCLDDSAGGRTFLSVGLDVTDFREAERRLYLLAEHDSVTGLLNRRAFKRDLDLLLDKHTEGVMAICDIDEFKSVNDSGGHEAGDIVLVEFARHIRNLTPGPTLAARLGGDDFALVFTGLGAADAIVLAKSLNQVMAHVGWMPEGVTRRRVSASVGLVAFPAHGRDADTLLANAELALTQARTKGHGSWHLYSPDDPYREAAERRTYWRGELEQALDENRLVLHFQPIQHITSSRIGHYEALLRLRDKDGGLVPPGLFIDVAESTGLIRRIDRWVVEEAVSTAATHPDVKIALNLSSRSFDDDMAFETMRVALAQQGVDGERLILEITETTALANFSSAVRIMAKFKELGCVFGLDDFGVGYSSFQYLRELPVEFVKIDGSFIKGLTQNPDDVVFVRALNEAVRGFGKETVAEFVEDEETLSILRDIGVDFAQGYLIGRPAPEMLQ